MLKIQSPLTGNEIQQPKCGRKPLQPKNCPPNLISSHVKPKLKPDRIGTSQMDECNKENLNQALYVNVTPTRKIEHPHFFDASLAEELRSIQEKLDRLRLLDLDREKTEILLKERELMLERNMKQLEKRGQVQKRLEIELDRLYRLNQLKSSCMRISPIRSLREKKQGRNIHLSQDMQANDRYESKDESEDES